jgi:hypothetical protein
MGGTAKMNTPLTENGPPRPRPATPERPNPNYTDVSQQTYKNCLLKIRITREFNERNGLSFKCEQCFDLGFYVDSFDSHYRIYDCECSEKRKHFTPKQDPQLNTLIACMEESSEATNYNEVVEDWKKLKDYLINRPSNT